VILDEAGNVVELRAVYDPETKGGSAPDGRKVKATLHWVAAEHSLPAEVRSTITCSTRRIPTRAISLRTSIPTPWRFSAMPGLS